MEDFEDPDRPFSLVKTALLCAGVVSEEFGVVSPTCGTLWEQLTRRLDGGLEVESWSLLPRGSGLGGRSVLSACLLVAVNRACGFGQHASARPARPCLPQFARIRC